MNPRRRRCAIALLTFVGASRRVDMQFSPEAIAEIDDRTLPIYTVLVPMYREANVLALLVAALRRLDYPSSKLEVKLVLEEDDHETIEVAKSLKLPGSFEIVRVPPSQPRTSYRVERGDSTSSCRVSS